MSENLQETGMKPRSVRDPAVTLTRICSVDPVPFPKLEWSLLAQVLSLTVPEAGMSLLLDATTLEGDCLVLRWAQCF